MTANVAEFREATAVGRLVNRMRITGAAMSRPEDDDALDVLTTQTLNARLDDGGSLFIVKGTVRLLYMFLGARGFSQAMSH